MAFRPCGNQWPIKVVSDNTPQYNSTRIVFSATHEFKHFAGQWGFQHTTSSPGYPQSNGCAERAVQTAKQIFRKATAEGKDPFQGLLKYRHTPFEDIGKSPIQLLMGRQTRTPLPTHRRLLIPQAMEPKTVVKALKNQQKAASAIYNKNSRDIPTLEAGDHVRIYKDRQWRKAEVLPRSYIARDERGQMFKRNQRHILATPNNPPKYHCTWTTSSTRSTQESRPCTNQNTSSTWTTSSTYRTQESKLCTNQNTSSTCRAQEPTPEHNQDVK